MEELVDQTAQPAPLLDPSDPASDRILSARSSIDVPSFSRLSLVDQEPAAVPNGKGKGKGKGKAQPASQAAAPQLPNRCGLCKKNFRKK